MDLIWITSAKHIRDYIISLKFSDGKTGNIDIRPLIEKRKSLLAPLLDINVFKNFTLNDWTISWDDGKIDIAPERLYELVAQ